MRRAQSAAALTVACMFLGAAAPAAAQAPATSGTAGIVVDARTGKVMSVENPRERRKIASATKLMTALLTLERADLDDVFKAAPYAAAPVESKINLRAGEEMKVRDLLTALLLESANDAAVTLAEGIAGSREAFVREMNRRAVELGLNDTSYANPIGFDDPNNYSSARDLAKLSRKLLRNREFARIVDLPSAELMSGATDRVIDNRNKLIAAYPFVSGVKTGHTMQAGYVLVGAGEKPGARVISVTLGAPSESARDADTLALLRWGLDQFRRRVVLRAKEPLTKVNVRYQDEDAELVAARNVSLVLRKGERTSTLLEEVPDSLEGPVEKGERVGWVLVRRGGKTVRRVPLVTTEEIEEATFIDRLTSGIGGWFLTVLAVLGMVASAMLVIRSRAKKR